MRLVPADGERWLTHWRASPGEPHLASLLSHLPTRSAEFHTGALHRGNGGATPLSPSHRSLASSSRCFLSVTLVFLVGWEASGWRVRMS